MMKPLVDLWRALPLVTMGPVWVMMTASTVPTVMSSLWTVCGWMRCVSKLKMMSGQRSICMQAAKRGWSNDYVTFPLCITCDYMGTNRPTPFSTPFSCFNLCMLQLADVGVKGRMHICIQHVLHTSAGTIYQYCNILLIYLLNIHIDMSYLTIDISYQPIIECIYRNYWVHILHMYSSSFTICGQVFGVKVYSFVSQFYVYSCTSLISIPPTTQYINILAIWSSQ